MRRHRLYEKPIEPTTAAQALAQDRTAAPTFPASAYPPWWRLVAATAFAASRASLPAILYAVLMTHVPVTPDTVLRWFVKFFMVPAAGAAVIARALAARVRIETDELTVARGGLRIDVPMASIAGVAPWWVALPSPGFGLLLGSGRRLQQGIGLRDPTPILRALAERDVAGAAAAVEHPVVVYARARAAHGRWRWAHLAARFPLFALGPTALLFNVHQHIAYGGLFGQYYMLGLGPYLQTFALYWATVTIYQVLYASLWRGLAESICLLAAAVAPSRAAKVRRAAELAIRVLYYGGVPALLVLRFAPW